jgi:hypothetical protein
MLTLERIAAYRAHTYRTLDELRVKTKEEAVAYVEARGFLMFWPIKGIEMPSLWAAVAGERPVADEHDDPGHVTWGWKDSLLDARQWYYGKILRRKATIISLGVAPAFYALSENFGSPEEDYLYQYQDGTMTAEAKAIYEALLREGPLNAVALRRAVSMTESTSSYRFNRGLEALQADFKVLPIGVAEAGAWNYAFIYECVHRYYPEVLEQAREIKISEAQQTLLELYLQSVGAAMVDDIVKVFWWSKPDVERAVASLHDDGRVVRDVQVEGQAGLRVAVPELVS